MTTGMFVLRSDGSLTPMSGQPYDSESLLQSWIADHPELLAGDQINPENPRRWLLISREAGVPGSPDSGARWSVDHLFIDQDGIPTFVEVKRSTDTRIRREVVGQILDYAANGLQYWPVESIQAMLAEQCANLRRSTEDEIRLCLGDETEPEALWAAVRRNLEDGSVRLLFVSDKIPQELLAVVEFLNKQMDRTEVLAVEVQQYVESGDSGLVTLVPRVLGQTIESQQKKRTTQTNQRSWNEASFFEEASHQLPEDEVGTLRAIYEWSVTNMSRISYGKGRTMGSFAGVLDLPSGQSWPINCYTNGFVEFTFQYMEFMKAFRDRGMRHKFLERLLLIKGFNPPVDDTILSRRPSIAVRELVSPGEMQKLIEALDWFVAEAKAG